MKAISLHQPWATWIAMGWKTIETRNHERFRGLVGQRIAIHAANRWDHKWGEAAEEWISADQFDDTIEYTMHWPRGALVCTAVVQTVGWPHDYDPTRDHADIAGRAMCEPDGKFLLHLKNIKALPHPIPWKGGRGIFNVPDEVISSANPAGSSD